jgi:putative hydroxymethylpyrimidine transport system ATP-binding protein
MGVVLKGASLDYGETPLFQDLQLDLSAGRVTALLGVSGVGKSTLLRMTAGLLPPGPGGTLAFNGDPSPFGHVAYMDQRDLLLPWLSAIDNVMLGSRLRGDARNEERATHLLDQVGLAGRERSRPAALSGGMRQRVSLARILYEDRPVVLMDEPFAAVDAITRLQLQYLTADLLKGRTVLFVTHDPLEALCLGHRVHVLSGRPARLDDPLVPPGEPPRDPATETLTALHHELLSRLGAGARP